MLFSEKTIGDLFEELVNSNEEKEFLIYPEYNLRYTYNEFNQRVNKLAKGLLSLGIKKGDFVGIWAKNRPDWITYMFATAKIGAILVLLNTGFKKEDIKYCLNHSDIKILIMGEKFENNNFIEIINSLIPALNHQDKLIKSTDFPNLKYIVQMTDNKYKGLLNTKDLLSLGEKEDDEILIQAKKQLNNEDIIHMQYTSGTEGFPKGALLTHKSIINNGYNIAENMNYTSNEKLCFCLLPFHVFGTIISIMGILTHSGTLVTLEEFNESLVLKTIEEEKCTALNGVPTMFIYELEEPNFDSFDLSSLKTVQIGASYYSPELIKDIIEKMNITNISGGYGLSETSGLITQVRVDDPLEMKLNSVGRPLQGVEIKIVKPNSSIEVERGEKGEIICKSPNMMKGYYKLDNIESFDKEGWFHTGDLAIKDDKGYFHIIGRLKDIIIKGGENISPKDIEDVLIKIPKVKDAQVIGIPDEEFGEEIVAFIIEKENSKITEKYIKDYCLNKITEFKIPKYIFFVNKFPKTSNGKIKKYELKKEALKRIS